MVVLLHQRYSLHCQPDSPTACFLGASPRTASTPSLLTAHPVLEPFEVEQVFSSLRLDKGSILLEENGVSSFALK